MTDYHRLTFRVSPCQSASGVLAVCLDCEEEFRSAEDWERSRCTARPECRILKWDGERLTVEGEPHFAIFITSEWALAEAVLKLACGDQEPTEREAAAFARSVIFALGLDGGFVMRAEGPARWLAKHRAGAAVH